MQGGNKKILIVEDDPEILELYCLKLRSAGYAAKTASDGEAGLSLIAVEPPDLLLLDIMLPKKDGYDLMQTLHQRALAPTMPIFILSNLSSHADRCEARRLGAARFFLKAEVMPAGILAEVHAALADTGA